MKKLWIFVNGMRIGKSSKNRIYLGVLILINLVAGSVLWLFPGRLLFPGLEWLLCFAGYPAVFVGLLGGVLYLYKHEFTGNI